MARKKIDKKSTKPSFIEKLKQKKRFVIINETTFEEQSHFSITPLNIITLSTFIVFLIVIMIYLVIAFTPVKYTIPGYPDASEVKKAKLLETENAKFLDDEKHKLEVEEMYYNNLISILNNQAPENPSKNDSSYDDQNDSLPTELSLNKSKEDSLLRLEIDQREKYQLNYSPVEPKGSTNDALNGVYFFPPLRGTISNTLDIKDGHFGVDIAAEKDEAVKAVLDGEIVFSDWSPEQGHILIIQHKYNILSVYKHNSFLLKKTGDFVKAGDAVAIVGSSGATSTGIHLHFELWYNGVCLDPLKFISF